MDTQRVLLEVVMQAAHTTDRAGAKSLLSKLWADRGDQHDNLARWRLERQQIHLELVDADPTQGGFAVQPRRWVVERTFSWFAR